MTVLAFISLAFIGAGLLACVADHIDHKEGR